MITPTNDTKRQKDSAYRNYVHNYLISHKEGADLAEQDSWNKWLAMGVSPVVEFHTPRENCEL